MRLLAISIGVIPLLLLAQPYTIDEPLNNKEPSTRVDNIWKDEQGRTRVIYRRQVDKKLENLFLRTMDANGKVLSEKALSSGGNIVNVRSPVEGGPTYLDRVDPKTGRIWRTEITTKATWPQGQKENLIPLEVNDPDQNLLPLTTAEGIPFHNFYYLPAGESVASLKEKGKVPKVVVMFKGGEQAYRPELEEEYFTEKPTIDFFRKQGYLVMLANYRGKTGISHAFRLSGMGETHTKGIDDVINGLDQLQGLIKFDAENVNLYGHSQGGGMAALVATRMGEKSNKYRVQKSFLSSPALNWVDGIFNFYQPVTDEYESEFDLGSDDWVRGAWCQRPKALKSDDAWKRYREHSQNQFQRYTRIYGRKMNECADQDYLNQSPYHHADKLQGTVMIINGDAETGSTNVLGAKQFQTKVGPDRVKVIPHSYGHGVDITEPEQKAFYLKQLQTFVDSNSDPVGAPKTTAEH